MKFHHMISLLQTSDSDLTEFESIIKELNA